MSIAISVLLAVAAEQYLRFSVSVDEVGVVFRDGVPDRQVGEGRHYLGLSSESVEMYPVPGVIFWIRDRSGSVSDMDSGERIPGTYSMHWRVCDAIVLSRLLPRFDKERVEAEIIDPLSASIIKLPRRPSQDGEQSHAEVVDIDSMLDLSDALRKKGVCGLDFTFRRGT